MANETNETQSSSSLEPEGRNAGGPVPGTGDSNPDESGFVPVVLDKTVITAPLFEEFKKKEEVYPVIIDVNLLYFAGREEAKAEVQRMIISILADLPHKAGKPQGINLAKTNFSQQYVFAVLQEEAIKELVRRDSARTSNDKRPPSTLQAIFHIWPDFKIKQLTLKSISTVKADAARNVFSALGEGIYWAVLDSGIDGTHLHFETHKNLELSVAADDPLQHRDFTLLSTVLTTNSFSPGKIDMKPDPAEKPLEDANGHGTHVAGIIAGELQKQKGAEMLAAGGPAGVDMQKKPVEEIIATSFQRDEANQKLVVKTPVDTRISGMAPKCKLVSLKVLDERGNGEASNLIAAIQWVQEINGYGRRIRIHGVNMSVGYEFDPLWFACGQSPLCVEVNRLVKSGVVVVVAAGNTGYGFVQAQGKSMAVTAGLDLTINDPGNADLAITVGSTHRDMPHVYGVSYFSSKGPTGDGRLKPDLVAPGEKIISCDSGQRRSSRGQEMPAGTAFYREESGTSMAAPHVSGVIAAFLSVRTEFIGRPEEVKQVFLNTATDLKRERYFQGYGLVDLMRAMQSV